MENPQQYYGSNGPMTAAGPDAVQLGALPHDLESLCDLVQSVLIHQDLASFAYGVPISSQQSRERPDSRIRPIARMPARILAIDAQPSRSRARPASAWPASAITLR